MEFSTIVDMFTATCAKHADRELFGTSNPDYSKFDWITYKTFEEKVSNFRKVLAKHNFGKGDRVAVIVNNRVEWAVIALAANTLGGYIVPMYEQMLESDWSYIVGDSGAKILIAANDDIYDKVKGYAGSLGNVESVFCLDAAPEAHYGYKHWMSEVANEIDVPIHRPKPSDVTTLIYTSGTTGKPKGVELTHANMVANIKDKKPIFDHEVDSAVTLAFLPWAHVFGQSCELYTLMATGSAIGIVTDRERILESFDLIRPTSMCAVPMLCNRIYDAVMAKVAVEPPRRQKIFHGALALSRRRNELLERGLEPDWLLNLQYKIADKLVFSKIRARFGGRLHYMAIGGAAASLPVTHFFEDIGIAIGEGYGLTETSPVVTCSSSLWQYRRLGTCGVVVPGTTVTIFDPVTMQELPADTEGEICVSGPAVFDGYRNNKEATAEVIFHHTNAAGVTLRYFRTGDLGALVEGKFLKLTGRIKEQFKLANGKFVVPAPVEDRVNRSPFVAQSVVHGDNREHAAVFVVPDVAAIREHASRTGLDLGSGVDDEALLQLPSVRGLLSKSIATCCQSMKSYERPRRWGYTLQPMTQENHLLTAKMSLRRNNILAAYGKEFDRICNEGILVFQ